MAEENKEEKKPEQPKPMIQKIVLEWADGRKGVFAGPAVISEGELALRPPKITRIIFTPPYELKVPTPQKEATDAPKADEKRAE